MLKVKKLSNVKEKALQEVIKSITYLENLSINRAKNEYDLEIDKDFHKYLLEDESNAYESLLRDLENLQS